MQHARQKLSLFGATIAIVALAAMQPVNAEDDADFAKQWANSLAVGGLINHIESFASDSHRNDVSATFVQPFLRISTKSKTSIRLNTKSTDDWGTNDGSVPINFNVSQMLVIGKQPPADPCGCSLLG